MYLSLPLKEVKKRERISIIDCIEEFLTEE